jgi:hypothetical protein
LPARDFAFVALPCALFVIHFFCASNNFFFFPSADTDMTRKHWMWLAGIVLLGGISIYLNKDWFAKDGIQIYHRSRPMRPGVFGRKRTPAFDSPAVNPVIFGFSRKLRLTSLKVVPVSDIETNRFPHAIWFLTSPSNSVPTKDFVYGDSIKGMKPAVQGAMPDPLEPGVNYRLFVEAGDFKAEHDFVPVPRTQ